ncbi:MAG: type II secretion system GspH family protein [Heliobacteriaceae bacterium]|jgi:prepilin-type N-terminal cleavage/methylation domain-containing protein|nr:type II secretion system GspH family protein [Heliobacteriaceae bacterium]
MRKLNLCHCERPSVARQSSQKIVDLLDCFALRARNDRVGFTLAEVLITLGIIGVVAALTLPALVLRIGKQHLEASFTKGYSTLQGALSSLNQEQGFETTPENYDHISFYYNIINHVKILRSARRGNYAANAGYKDFNKKYNISLSLFDDGQIILQDGTFWAIENPYNGPDTHIMVFVDTNGMMKQPNALGHDLFVFQIVNDGKLLPMGAQGTEYEDSDLCSKTYDSNVNGMTCALKALTEPDYFKNLP